MRKTLFTFAFLIAFLTYSQLPAYNLDSLMIIVEAKYAKIHDYTCIFSKKELIDGDYYSAQNIIYKYRKPDNYYMKWTEGNLQSAEIIYAGKKYNYKMRGHLGGILNLKNFDVDPKGSIAMKNNRHSIFESSLGFVIQLMRKNLQLAKKYNVGKIELLKEVVLNNRKTTAFKAEFPENKGFYGHVIHIYLDNLLSLPVKFDVFDWNHKLIESYTYLNIKLNPGLKDIDFDADNKDYNF